MKIDKDVLRILNESEEEYVVYSPMKGYRDDDISRHRCGEHFFSTYDEAKQFFDTWIEKIKQAGNDKSKLDGTDYRLSQYSDDYLCMKKYNPNTWVYTKLFKYSIPTGKLQTFKVTNSHRIFTDIDEYIQTEQDPTKLKKAKVIKAILQNLEKANWNLDVWQFDSDDVSIQSDRHEAGRWTMLDRSQGESNVDFIVSIINNTIRMPWYYDTGASEPWYLIKDDYDALCKIAKACETKFNIPVQVNTGTKAWISFTVDDPDAWDDQSYTDLTAADFENDLGITDDQIIEAISKLDNTRDMEESDIIDLVHEIIDECGID